MIKAGILCFLSLMFVQTAYATSFDCEKAGSKVEKMICADPELSKLDDELGKAYSEALKKSSDPSTLKQHQRKWMEERNNCPKLNCVKQTYEMRIQALSSFPSRHATSVQKKDQYRYQLILGSEHELCEQVLKRMNEELSHKPYGPVCAIDFLRSTSGVVFPEWKKLDLEKNQLLYNRFILANLVREKYYPQIFGKQPSSTEEKVGLVRMPANDQLVFGANIPGRPFGEPMTSEQLDSMWKGAVAHKSEFYRWDGVLPEPDNTDVLLIEVSRYDALRDQDSCAKHRMLRFSADLRMPKPWKSEDATWLIGPDAISFKYNKQFFRLNEVLSEAGQLSNGVSIDVHNGRYCLIQGNIFFPLHPQ